MDSSSDINKLNEEIFACRVSCYKRSALHTSLWIAAEHVEYDFEGENKGVIWPKANSV